VLRRALEVYELDRLDFAEAHLVAHAEVTGVNATVARHEPWPLNNRFGFDDAPGETASHCGLS
jgi:hypothetical protein